MNIKFTKKYCELHTISEKKKKVKHMISAFTTFTYVVNNVSFFLFSLLCAMHPAVVFRWQYKSSQLSSSLRFKLKMNVLLQIYERNCCFYSIIIIENINIILNENDTKHEDRKKIQISSNHLFECWKHETIRLGMCVRDRVFYLLIIVHVEISSYLHVIRSEEACTFHIHHSHIWVWFTYLLLLL